MKVYWEGQRFRLCNEANQNIGILLREDKKFKCVLRVDVLEQKVDYEREVDGYVRDYTREYLTLDCGSNQGSFFLSYLTCPFPYTIYFVDVSCFSPIGPLACSFCVLIPISAPKPNSKPSVKRVEAFT